MTRPVANAASEAVPDDSRTAGSEPRPAPARATRLEVFVLSWPGRHAQAIATAEAIAASGQPVAIVFSDPDLSLVLDTGVRSIRRSDHLVWADKFRACLDRLRGDSILVIQADTECADWAALVSRCRDALERHAAIGVWTPAVDRPRWSVDACRFARASTIGISAVAEADPTVIGFSPAVVARLREAEFDDNFHGWGIDELAVAAACERGLLPVVDEMVAVTRWDPPEGSHESALRQREAFLGQLTAAERMHHELLTDFAVINHAVRHPDVPHPLPGHGRSVASDAAVARVARLQRAIVLRQRRGLTAIGVEEAETGRRLAATQGSVPSAEVTRAQDFVSRHVPPAGVVAVVSEGDEDHVGFAGPKGWHFPQTAAGLPADRYPVCDLSVVAHLESLRARGATHLLLPDALRWWLTVFPGLDRRLKELDPQSVAEDGVGRLYRLQPTESTSLLQAVGPVAHVLDWTAGSHLTTAFPRATVFQPPVVVAPDEPLPYIDASIEVVAVGEPTPRQLAEARRVALRAVVAFPADHGQPRIEWLDVAGSTPGVSASIVVPVFDGQNLPDRHVQAILETLVAMRGVEVIVVDGTSNAGDGAQSRPFADWQPRLKTIHVQARSAGAAFQAGAAVARHDHLVFLGPGVLPIGTWLTDLLAVFGNFPAAGVVGAKVLAFDGRLEELGGMMFRGAVMSSIGRGDPDPSRLPFEHVRRLDYVSPTLLATPRDLFERLRGFDQGFRSDFHQAADYCFRCREVGRDTYVQPAAVVVAGEPIPVGHDPDAEPARSDAGDRERFRERHADALSGRPERPSGIGPESWAALLDGHACGVAP